MACVHKECKYISSTQKPTNFIMLLWQMEVLKFFLVRLMSMSFCCLHVLYSTDKYTEGERVLCVFASQNLFRKVLSFTSLELNFIKFVNAIEKIMNFSAKSKTGAKVCWLYPFIIYLTEVYEGPSWS